ncbi:hypothetical protein DL240_18740 [Lujinxingia litoralis]|uniref:DUF4382 domain-containing protein n=1 Tax=Lujinxingia litoralis TaxID=2211119 RepID=A0A328C4X2_9DELT|nr:hypothetical protein [Lujinxingia litoralis]RAL20070.1 hypothetical protein DL240_18740 [Lujinxingia litoralis]
MSYGKRSFSLPMLAALLLLGGCGEPEEAPRVDLGVVVDGQGLTGTTTDLGYTIELREARLAPGELHFTVAGDAHMASLGRRVGDLLIPLAHAHPGHFEGGEVTGELEGSHEVDWASEQGREMGRATLLPGDYRSADFTFHRLADAPHLSARLAGTATRQGQSVDFTFEIAAPPGRRLTGAPFEATVRAETRGELGFRLTLVDPSEGDHLFDGVDFEALATDATLSFSADTDDDTYFSVRRRLLSHDHYELHLEDH